MSRDELIEQAARTMMPGAFLLGPIDGSLEALLLATRLVDKDWRPVVEDEATVERVARGLHDYLAPHPELGIDDRDDGRCVACTLIARAALRALRGEASE